MNERRNADTSCMVRLRMHSVIKITALLALPLVATVACSKKDETGQVRIVFPTAPATANAIASAANANDNAPATKTASNGAQQTVSAQTATSPEWNSSLNPTTGSEINCFAVFIGGGELNANSCSTTNASSANGSETITFGPNVGFVPAGQDVLVDVPSGERTIYVIGLRSATSTACKSYFNSEPDAYSLSQPFIIASQRAVIPAGPSTVTVNASLDVNRKISSCTFIKRDAPNGSTPFFGDKRDGKLLLAGSTPLILEAGTKTYNFTADMTHTPATATTSGGATSGGSTSTSIIASTKLYSSTRRVLSISNSGDYPGRYLNVGAFTAQAFEPGDEVLWHVTAGTTSSGPPDDPINGACGSDLNIGRWGTAKVKATGNALGWLILDTPLASNPAQIKNGNLASAPGANFCRISITRVASFEELRIQSGADWTLKAQPFDLANGTGGVQAIRIDKLIVDGNLKIDGIGTGFAGGLAQTSGTSYLGVGGLNSTAGNASGGGSSASNGGAGGAGANEGGSGGSLVPVGGMPMNTCSEFSLESLNMGMYHACGRTADGRLYCWGSSNNSGLLGEGMTNTRRLRPREAPLSQPYQAVSTGLDSTCGITFSNSVYCWGLNNFGQLGDGTTTTRTSPVLIDGGAPYLKIAVGKQTTCGITTSGQLKCWGYNNNGQVGDGSTINRTLPTIVDGGMSYLSVAVGDQRSCGITVSNQLKCWGKNTGMLLATGGSTMQTTPFNVDSGTPYQSVSVLGHVCGITSSGQLKCWGDNTYGQLGRGNTISDGTPTMVSGVAAMFKQVGVGLYHSCGLTYSDQLYCWGQNNFHQVDTSGTIRLSPIESTPGLQYESFSTGHYATCGRSLNNGRWSCWGNNMYGNFGNGAFNVTVQDPTPVRAELPCLAMTSGKSVIGGGAGGGFGVVGGAGGGLILVWAREISGSGSIFIKANGGAGLAATGGSGGGGGGNVGVVAKSIINANVYISANGGAGGTHASAGGGGGSGGTVELRYCSVSSPGFNPSFLTANFGASGGSTSDTGVRGVVTQQNEPAVCSMP